VRRGHPGRWLLGPGVLGLVLLGSPPRPAAADGFRLPPGELPGAPNAVAGYLEERDHVALIELAGDYGQLYEGEVNALPRALVAREFFARHPDHYDFLIAFSSFEFDTGEAEAFHLGVRNDIQGIGLPLYDSSDLFGSAGRLRGYVDMAALTRHATDPLDPDFEEILAVLAHEILHQWGAYVRFKRPDGTLSDALLGRDGSHWSFLLDSDASVLYGNDWRDDGNGGFTSAAALQFFSPLDLYLAGFFAPGEVPPFVLIENPAVDPSQLPRRGARVEGEATLVTVDDVIAAEGPRVPPAAQSPKDFRAAFVLLVRPGQEASAAQIAVLERIREGLTTRFAVLTGGRAVLEVFPEALPVGEPGAPPEVAGGPPRDTEASLLDGLAWLRSRQSPDGYWQDRPATRTRDTGLALSTLASQDAQFTGAGAAIDWLLAQEEVTTDSLARSAVALAARGRDPTGPRSALGALQNPDGGWGLGPGYASDPLDTALALLALAGGPGVPAAAPDAGIAYLLSARGPDGGWGSHPGGPGRAAVSAAVLRAFQAAGRSLDVAPAALAFLASRQNPDGGFGDSPSTVHDTAAVLQALMSLGAVESVASGEALGFLRARQATDGSWAGSVYATALALDTLKRFGFPNWRFSSAPQAEPASPRDGERVRLTFTVANDGNVEAPAGRLRLYEGDPDAGGVPSGPALELPPLGARQSVQLTLLWDSFDRPGTRRLVAILDPDGEVAELSELDNRAEVELEVRPAPEAADLEVTGADLAVSPARPDSLPASLAISATVRNVGQTDVPEVAVQLLVGPPEDGVVVGEAALSVPQRSSTPVHFAHLLETPGTTTFTVVVDTAGEVAEADETNNQAWVSVSTAAAVDLAVDASDLAVEGEAFVGNDFALRAVLRNLGTVDAPDAEVRFSVTDGAQTREVLATTVRIPAGSTAERSAVWRVDLSGELTFRVEIDPRDLVPERDETNNAAAVPFTAQGIDVPDLAVDHRELAFTPDPGLEGSPLEISVVVHNFGGQEVTDVEVAFYQGDPAQGAPLLGEIQVLPSLGPGASAVAGVTLPPLAGAGDRLIYAVVDPDDRVAEFDEGNNAAFRTLEVLALPDLAVTPAAVESAPALPQAGQEVTTTVTVANLGEQEARDVAVRLAVDGAAAAPDQTLLSIPPDGTATAVFTWSFPTAGGTVTLAATADPENAIPESNEANNRAERPLAGFDPDRSVSHPYFSPNGDGVQDTTVYSFTLGAPETVVVEVLDSRGRVVRRHGGADLVEVVKGRFEWDGRDAAGRIVPDGDYRFRALGSSARVLDEAPVVVDTDRWPLFAALGTPFERITNLTCSLVRASDPQFPRDEEEAFFRVFGSYFFSSQQGEFIGSGGIYRVPASGHPFERVLGVSFPEYLEVSDDGEKMAYDPALSGSPLATANTDASDRQLIEGFQEVGAANVALRPGTQDLVYLKRYPSDPQTNYRLLLRPLDGSGPEWVAAELPFQNGSFITPSFRSFWMSPDGGKLVYNACFRSNTSTSPCPYELGLLLLDIGSGVSSEIAVPPFELTGSVAGMFFAGWSPDGSRFALVVNNRETELGLTYPLLVYDRNGLLQRIFEPPAMGFRDVPDYEHLGRPGVPDEYQFIFTFSPYFSPDGGRIAFVADYIEGGSGYSASWGSLLVGDVTKGEVTTVAYLEPSLFLFSFAVETWDGQRWLERGELHHGLLYSERELDLSAHLPDPDGEYKVRIRQTGLEAAHVDRALLRVGRSRGPESERRPVSAVTVPGGADVLDPLLAVDREVLDLHERQVELRWEPFAAGGEGVRLALVAREEDLSSREARPFRYPAGSGRSYHHRLGSGAPMLVDGRQTGADGLAEPLFAQWSLPDTGHPGATVYGYAGSDSEYLYATLDFTVDNTEDGERDWAALWVETPGGWRELRVTASDTTWGEVGFTRTGRVGYPHKYYEFRVPLAEIGAAPGDTVALRFEAYGTAALLDAGTQLPLEGIPLWARDEAGKLLYYAPFSGSTWLLDLEQAGPPRRVLEEFTTFHGAYFSPSGRKLVFRDGRDILDPGHECHNPSSQAESSHFTSESLANDFVALFGEPTPDGRGVELSGTATDLHFARWRLEYADETVPGFWTPMGPPVEVPVVDEELTVWIPPGPEAFLVRLTVEDLAGNRRSAVRRFATSANAPVSITDLHLAPRYISPNGDGVQDAATLHYRVLAPVHLEIGVFGENGDRVRTLRRDHSVIGSEHDVLWDGRNDSGLPVPDGRYTVEVQGYSFPVTVDSVPPEIAGVEPEAFLTLVGKDGTVPADLFGERYLDFGLSVAWCASDAHPGPGGLLSIGDGAGPAAWRAFASAGTLETCPPRQEWPGIGLTFSQYVGHRFRLEARDLAGNSSAAETLFGDEKLFVYRFREHPAGAGGAMDLETAGIPSDSRVILQHGGRARLRLAETARSPLSSLFVQVRPGCGQGNPVSGGSGPWQEVEVTELYEPDSTSQSSGVPQHELDFVWDPSFLDPVLPYCVQLRARTVAGQDLVSNPLGLTFRSQGLFYHGRARTEDFSDTDGDGQLDPLAVALASALDLAGLHPDETPVLWARETLDDPLTDVSLVLTSEDDPRYAAGKPLRPAAISGRVMVFDGSDLLPCHTYRGVVVGRVVPADGSSPAPVESNPGTTALPCMAVEAAFRPVPLPACGGPPETVRRLVLTPKSFDGVELTLLTLALVDRENLVFSVNRPVSERVYEAEIDTTDLPEGRHLLFVRLSNGEGKEVVRRGAIVADRQPLAARVTHPAAGQRLCATPDDTGARGVTVEGRIEEVGAGPAGAGLQVLASDGAWPPLPADFTPGFGAGSAPSAPLAEHAEDVERRLEGLGSEITVRWVATDAGGHRACSEPVSFFFDGRVEGLAVVADRDLISPNGDGIAEETLLAYSAAEPLVLEVEVYRGVERTLLGQRLVEPVGEPLRTLASGLATAGGGGLPWDGRTDGVAVVEDGLYAVVFRAIDGCGNQARVVHGVTVDTTAPEVEILAPAGGEDLPLVVEVIATATDLHLLDYHLEHGVGAAPFTWTTVQREHRQLRPGRAGLWNTYGLQGDQTLRLTARDRVGNAAVHVVTVTLPLEESVITDLQAVPDPLSPNGDGRRETASLRFGFAQEVTASLAVTSGGGEVVRSLAAGETFPAGAALRTWDGRDAAGQRVADGEYRVRLEAAAVFDPSRAQVESIPLLVDGTPPAIAVTRPRQGFSPGAGAVVGTVSDPLLVEFVVELAEDPDLPDWREIGRGEAEVADGELAALDGLAEGSYALRISARDATENRSELVVPFEVDDTPPDVALDAPAAGSVVGAVGGPVAIRGAVVEEHPHSWRLGLGAGEALESWTALASGEGLPPATLVSWDVGPVPDGIYTLRLAAEDLGGLTGEVRMTVAVDNTPPVVALTAPAADAWITGPTTIMGTTADPNLQLYSLEVAAEASAQWSELGRSASQVAAGVLLSWQALPPDGPYRLRLRAQDAAGNAAAVVVPVTVDTRPRRPRRGSPPPWRGRPTSASPGRPTASRTSPATTPTGGASGSPPTP
jgi:subtilase family serine protease/flagellar hook assembly protein FlgD